MAKDMFTKSWIIENSVQICSRYAPGVLTLRGLHYQLVGIGMTNDLQHYKRVVSAMIDARWDGDISFDQFSDLDRAMEGQTESAPVVLEEEIERAKGQVRAWMVNYGRNRWEKQPIYPEVLIEKKALQGVFGPICRRHGVGLGACKGYPSLTFLNEMAERLQNIAYDGKHIVVLYFGDYDPSGEDIPRSIVENLARFGVRVDLRRIALMKDQVLEWRLPPAPAKLTDSRTKNWDGLGQVELDAVKPEKLQQMCEEAILSVFDDDVYERLIEEEGQERTIYRAELRKFVNGLNDE